MRESFVHYLWSKQMFVTPQLMSVQNEKIQVVHPGVFTGKDGPDFFNAQLYLNEQLWAGNVEIHLKASDWYAHRHEEDIRYDNVILHVVWEFDVPVFRTDGTEVPTLAVSQYTCASIQEKCKELFIPKKRLNCEKHLHTVSSIVWMQWKERLYVERLEQKVLPIQVLSNTTSNHWEYVFFCFLAKSFGLNSNADIFFGMAQKLSVSIIYKHSNSLLQLEAMFMGLVGLLDNSDANDDSYVLQLKKEWIFIKEKWQLESTSKAELQFFQLRPSNFPTVRLAQLAAWLFKNKNDIATLLTTKDIGFIRKSFDIEVSEYWKDHYVFNTTSKVTKKKLSKSFIDLVIMNTIVPLQFAFSKYKGEDNETTDKVLEMMYALKPEVNTVVSFFNGLGVPVDSAVDSQALLQLKKQYCDKNKCLQCTIGKHIINY
ncbi:MAG: DUF2851 family protein [Flavobacteriaceae bacterium]|jgi:hypothetical protein|nr:DUF2851 family protein [Flavobacteriaceae bacterium]